MGKRKGMGRRRAGHHTTLVIPNETDQNRSSLMVGKRRDLWTKEVGAKTKPPMVWATSYDSYLILRCVVSEGGVASDESGDQPRPSDASVMEQQMTYGGPEYAIDWEEVKRGQAAGMPGRWVGLGTRGTHRWVSTGGSAKVWVLGDPIDGSVLEGVLRSGY